MEELRAELTNIAGCTERIPCAQRRKHGNGHILWNPELGTLLKLPGDKGMPYSPKPVTPDDSYESRRRGGRI
jgi:hypothetical protein